MWQSVNLVEVKIINSEKRDSEEKSGPKRARIHTEDSILKKERQTGREENHLKTKGE